MASAPEERPARRAVTGAREFALAALVLAGGLAGGGLGSRDAAAAAPSCEAPRGFKVQGRLESPSAVVLFRTVPPAIEVGRHFVVEAVLCPALPDSAGAALRVDARMPEHRHGMNYRPRVFRKAEGIYVAEGLLFHMPGLWQLMFDVDRGGRTERLMTDIELE